MSLDRDDNSREFEVEDDGTVDERVKNRILTARERVDEREDLLFTTRVISDDLDFGEVEATEAWGYTVRQYIRSIEPLLQEEDVKNSAYYYRELDFGEVTLVPPDTEDYPFSRFGRGEYGNIALLQSMGLPPSFDPPKPHNEPFQGLRDIIEKDRIQKRWVVCVDDSGPPPTHDYVELEREIPTPKHLLEDAVRAADEFLQHAGVGLAIGKNRDEEAQPF